MKTTEYQKQEIAYLLKDLLYQNPNAREAAYNKGVIDSLERVLWFLTPSKEKNKVLNDPT